MTPAEPCLDCGIDRRAFLARGALLAAAAALSACGAAGGETGPAPTLSSPSTLKLSDYPALSAVGGVASVTISNAPFAIVRTGASSFVALWRVCPHQGGVVNSSGTGFLCPNHGAQFNSAGTWIGGQRTSSLRAYATSYDAAAGTVTVTG